MENSRKDRLTELVDAASGAVDPSRVRSEDRAKLAQFQFILSRLDSGFFDAPAESVARAKALVPKPERQRLGVRLLGTTMGLAGVRLESGDETQAVFDAEGVQVRVMYGRIPSGYTVVGRVEGEDWTATCSGTELLCEPDGQFQFTVHSADKTGVLLRSPVSEFSIPSFEELLQSADDLDRPR